MSRFISLDEAFPENADEGASSPGFISLDDAFPEPATFGQAVGRGVDQMQGMLYGAVEATGELVGSDAVTEFGREGRERNREEAAQYPARQNFLDIRGVGDAGQWAKEVVGEQIPMFAPSLAGGAAGAAVGSLAGPIGAVAGGLLGAFVPSFAMGTGEVQGAIKDKDPDVVAPGYAFAGGSAIAALDAIVPGKFAGSIARRFGVDAAETVAREVLLKRVAKGVGKTAAIEGITEGLQEVIAEATVAQATGQEISEDWWKQAIEGFAAGALFGGVFGAGSSIATPGGRREPGAGTDAAPGTDTLDGDASEALDEITGEAPARRTGAALDPALLDDARYLLALGENPQDILTASPAVRAALRQEAVEMGIEPLSAEQAQARMPQPEAPASRPLVGLEGLDAVRRELQPELNAQRQDTVIPTPIDRERVASPRLTPEDRSSPLSNDLIDDGGNIIEKALRGEAPVSDTALRDATPASQIAPETQGQATAQPSAAIDVGQDVTVTYPDGETFSARVDATEARDGGTAYRVIDTATGEVSEIYPGEARIAPVQAAAAQTSTPAPTAAPETQGQAGVSPAAAEAASAQQQTVPENSSGRRTASWVVKDRATGEVIMETFDRNAVAALRTDRFEAVPIEDHLASLNQGNAAPARVGLTPVSQRGSAAADATPAPSQGAESAVSATPAPAPARPGLTPMSQRQPAAATQPQAEPSFLSGFTAEQRAAFDKAPKSSRDVAVGLGAKLDEMRDRGVDGDRLQRLQAKLDDIVEALGVSPTGVAPGTSRQSGRSTRSGLRSATLIRADELDAVLTLVDEGFGWNEAVAEVRRRAGTSDDSSGNAATPTPTPWASAQPLDPIMDGNTVLIKKNIADRQEANLVARANNGRVIRSSEMEPGRAGFSVVRDSAPKATPPPPAAPALAPARIGLTPVSQRQPVAEAASQPRIVSRTLERDTAITATGREVPVTYAVVEAQSLVASQTDNGRPNSAYPADMQPRDRTREVSQAQIAQIAQNINPRLLDKNPLASDGAPIISDAGIVESGNGRALALRRAYAQGFPSAKAYRDYLAAQGYPVDGMDQPVLVRIRDGEMSTEDRRAFTREANERSTLGMSATERAMTDSAAMSDELLSTYRGGDVESAANRDFVRRFIDEVVSPGDRAGMIGADGALSQEATRRIESAMLARAYGDAGLVSALVESPDTNIKALGGALMDVAAEWAQMRAEAADSTISPDVDQTSALLEAVRMVQRARRESRPLFEYVGQSDAFSGRAISEAGEAFLRLMFHNTQGWTRPSGRDKVADALRFYTTEARKTGTGTDLLGAAPTPPGQILDLARSRTYDKAEGQQQDIFAGGAQPAGADAGTRRGDGAAQDGPRREDAGSRETAGERADAQGVAPPARQEAPAAETKSDGPAKASDLSAQTGERAYVNMSFSPDRRAQSDIAEYVRDVNELHTQMMERAETAEQRAVVEAEIARYREGYITRQNMLWSASARTASPMITGPANFPAAQNRKALDAYDKKIKDFIDWQKKAKASIKKKVNAARTGEQAASSEWDALRRDIAGSIAEIRNIDAGSSPMSRAAFTDSIKRKIETRANRGDADSVRRALDMVREAQAGMAKPIFTDRNDVWQLGTQAASVEATPAATGETTLAEYDGARIVDDADAERVRIYFDAKPSADVIRDLKGSAWRWSPSAGAWQRQNTNAARSNAQVIMNRHFDKRADGLAEDAEFSRAPAQARSTPFFSGVERAANGLSDNKRNGLQWLAEIRKQPGVKAEEIDWLGLPQWLADRKGITKAEVLDYIRANQVQVVETVRAASDLEQKAKAKRDAILERVRREGRSEDGVPPLEWFVEEQQRNDRQGEDSDGESRGTPKYADYTLPGGENYRELLIRMPSRSEGGITDAEQRRLNQIDDRIEAGTVTAEEMAEYDTLSRKAMETREDKDTFTSAHFSEANILAHVRFNERTGADGERVLFIEEIQSDWHQAGRKRGYDSPERKRALDDMKARLAKAEQEYDAKSEESVRLGREARDAPYGPEFEALIDQRQAVVERQGELRREMDGILSEMNRSSDAGVKNVPDAPLKKTWHETAFRRAVAWAAENGFDRVSWTTGQQQADRFDLSKRVNKIEYKKNDDGTYDLLVTGNDRSTVFDKQDMKLSEIEDTIGKEMAQKIERDEGKRASDASAYRGWKEFTGLDLKVGGEGMKGFYDKILPSYASKWGRKFGADVGKTSMPMETGKPTQYADFDAYMEAKASGISEVWTMPVTDAMRETVQREGVPLFARGETAEAETALRPRMSEAQLAEVGEIIGRVSGLSEFQIRDTIGMRGDDPGGAAWGLAPGKKGNAAGAYFASTRAIVLALDYGSPRVAYHESFHDLQNVLLTDKERATLAKSEAALRAIVASDPAYANDAAAMSQREIEAEAFAIYATRKDAGQPVTTFPMMVRAAFARIERLVRAVRNWLDGNGFQTFESVFESAHSGDIASRPRDAQGKFISDADAIRQTEETAASYSRVMDGEDVSQIPVRGADRKFIKDQSTFAKWAVYPRTLAATSRSFARVYRAAVEQFQKRDIIIDRLSRLSQPYFEMTPEGRAKVNAALEIGRLRGMELKADSDGSVTVKNTVRDTELSKFGETIRLDANEAAGYLSVRKAMGEALDLFRRQVMREFKLDADTFPSSKAISDSITDAMPARERERRETAARVVREIEQARRTGYVPFSRFGSVVVTVRQKLDIAEVNPLGGNPMEYKTLWSRAVEVDGLTGMAALMMSKGRLEDIPSVRQAMNEARRLYGREKDIRIDTFQTGKQGMLQGSGMTPGDIDLLAEVAKFDQNQHDRLMDAFGKIQQERGFRKHFFGSRNVPGYSSDIERSIADYIIGIGGYLARREQQDAWAEAIDAIPDTMPKEKTYAQDYETYINNPTEEMVAFRQLGFFYFIAGNVSTAMLNLSQVPIFTAPYMTMFANPARIAKELGSAYVDATRMMSRKAGFDIFSPDKAPADVRDALQKAWSEGQFVPLQTFEMMGTAYNRTAALRGLSKKTRKIVDTVALTYSYAERMNRVATWIAAYRMAKADPEGVRTKARETLKDSALAKMELLNTFSPEAFASWVVDETHFKLGKVNRPTMMRGPGAAILQFKSFPLNALELQYRMAKMYGRPGKVAFATNMVALIIAGGALAFPFGDDLTDLMELIYKFWTDTDLDIRTEAREAIAEMTGSAKFAELAMKGGLRAAGVDMSQRVGMGRQVPRSSEEAAGVPFSLFPGKAMSIAEYAKRGDYMLAAGEFMPNFLRNPIHAFSWSQDGVRGQASGRAVIRADELTGFDVGAKALGFNPSYVAERRDEAFAATRADTSVDNKRRLFYTRLARAIADGSKAQEAGNVDRATRENARVQEIIDEIHKHNETAATHEIIQIHPPTLRQRIAEEYLGLDSRRGRRLGRERRQELQSIYSTGR